MIRQDLEARLQAHAYARGVTIDDALNALLSKALDDAGVVDGQITTADSLMGASGWVSDPHSPAVRVTVVYAVWRGVPTHRIKSLLDKGMDGKVGAESMVRMLEKLAEREGQAQ